MKVSLLLSVILSTTAVAAVETRHFDAHTIKDVDVRNQSGKVEVIGTQDAKASITANSITTDEKCRIEMKQEGARLIARVDRRGLFRNGECKVNLVLRVPSEAHIAVKNGSGPVDIQNSRGEVEYRLGSGDIKVNGKVQKIDGSSGSGSAEISGMAGDAKFRMGSGNLKLKYAVVPKEKSELDVRNGSGDTEVLLPPSTKVLAQSFTGSGRVYNELGDSKDANLKISFKSGSGNLTIKKK